MTGTVCKCYYDMSKSTSEAIIPPPALTIQDNVIELSRNSAQNASIYTLFSLDKGLEINIFQRLYRYVFFVKYAWKKDRTNVRSCHFCFYCKVGTGRAAVVDACCTPGLTVEPAFETGPLLLRNLIPKNIRHQLKGNHPDITDPPPTEAVPDILCSRLLPS